MHGCIKLTKPVRCVENAMKIIQRVFLPSRGSSTYIHIQSSLSRDPTAKSMRRTHRIAVAIAQRRQERLQVALASHCVPCVRGCVRVNQRAHAALSAPHHRTTRPRVPLPNARNGAEIPER
eukprot:6179057-Pleurochrysis_carterae.AAC.2